MKDRMKARRGRCNGSVSSNGLIWWSNASGSRKNMRPKRRLLVQRGVILKAQAPKVFIGPSVEGKRMKLVEVVSGSVEDKKPFYV
ncbi:hypothetical protein [Brevibacillus sp. H7]|uniref:hypothetical protein n=1 Tax=Brevibacillus sp. H7 TaxID=3349138 RepID=UPI00382F0A8C